VPSVSLFLVAAALWQQPELVPARSEPVADSSPATDHLSTTIGPAIAEFPVHISPVMLLSDTGTHQRPHAIDYSEAYGVRLTIHHYASYLTLPLFAAEYALGQSLYSNPPAGEGSTTRQAHSMVAAGIAGLFVVNTVTGGWNLWDSRKDSSGRVRRYIHAGLMIVADAGFVATGASAPGDDNFGADPNARARHRTIAITSMVTALAAYGMMLVWKD